MGCITQKRGCSSKGRAFVLDLQADITIKKKGMN